MILLFFGSFNPPHIAHFIIAYRSLTGIKGVKEVWFVPSPRSPFKETETLLPFELRCRMLEKAIEGIHGLKVCRIEGELPLPSYTASTLKKLIQLYPEDKFALLMGTDTYISLPLWKNSQWIIDNFDILIYPRKTSGEEKVVLSGRAVKLNFPVIEMSSTEIRNMLASGITPHFMLHPSTIEILMRSNFLSSS